MKINLTSDLGFILALIVKIQIFALSLFSIYCLSIGSYFNPVIFILIFICLFYFKNIYKSKKIYFDEKYIYYDNKIVDIKKIRKFGENYLEIEEQDNVINKIKFISFFSNTIQTLKLFYNKKN